MFVRKEKWQMKNMRILFITTNGIENKEFGGAKASIRNYEAIKQFADVDVYHIKKRSNVKSLFSIMQMLYPPILKKDIKEVEKKIVANKYDLVFCDSSNLGDVVKNIKRYRVPVAVFFHNCEADYNQVRFGGKNSLKSKVYQKLIDKAEKKAVEYSDYKMVFTQRDKERIENLYNTKINAIIPIGMKDTFDITKKYKDEGYCLLLGPLGTANEEAFGWFVREVSPYINCKTVVAGKGFEIHQDDWATDKVVIKGFVEDLNELYGMASCVAIPLFSGGGMKIKTVEALMHGKYIFGTDEAFVGFELDYDEIGGLCNNSEEFITSINKFIEKDKCHNSIARNIYEKKYSLQAGYEEFLLLEKFIKR